MKHSDSIINYNLMNVENGLVGLGNNHYQVLFNIFREMDIKGKSTIEKILQLSFEIFTLGNHQEFQWAMNNTKVHFPLTELTNTVVIKISPRKITMVKYASVLIFPAIPVQTTTNRYGNNKHASTWVCVLRVYHCRSSTAVGLCDPSRSPWSGTQPAVSLLMTPLSSDAQTIEGVGVGNDPGSCGLLGIGFLRHSNYFKWKWITQMWDQGRHGIERVMAFSKWKWDDGGVHMVGVEVVMWSGSSSPEMKEEGAVRFSLDGKRYPEGMSGVPPSVQFCVSGMEHASFEIVSLERRRTEGDEIGASDCSLYCDWKEY